MGNNKVLSILGDKIVDLEIRQGFISSIVEEISDPDLLITYGLREAIYGYYATLDEMGKFHCRVANCLKPQLILDKRLMAITTKDGEYIGISSLGLSSETIGILMATNKRVILCADHIAPSILNPRYEESPEKFALLKFPGKKSSNKRPKPRKK
ncbi:hypothetical protein IT412_02980 [Candidatus Peregrinibacteria bacterium]|nr:hypothetical protein [Candidatus Peregrinibacteria bacterium]